MLHLRGPTGEGPQRGPPARGRLLPGTPLHAHCSCRARSSGNAQCAPREAVSAQAPSLVLSRFFQHRAWRGVFVSRGGSRAAAAMAEEASATAPAPAPAPAAAAVAGEGRMTMVVGVDDSEHSFYALQWALQHFFAPGQGLPQLYRLAVVTAKPTAASVVGFAGPGAADVLPLVEADLKRSSMRVIDKAKELCAQSQVSDAVFEVVEGDARNVLCDAVERHHAEMLVVGSHGYGAIKRAVLGSVSDYCAHHAHCTVMIVKKPKHKH